MLHEIRSDDAQMMFVLFLRLAGPGPWSRLTFATDLPRPPAVTL